MGAQCVMLSSMFTAGTTGADPASTTWSHRATALPHTSHLGATVAWSWQQECDIAVTAAPEHGLRLAGFEVSGTASRWSE